MGVDFVQVKPSGINDQNYWIVLRYSNCLSLLVDWNNFLTKKTKNYWLKTFVNYTFLLLRKQRPFSDFSILFHQSIACPLLRWASEKKDANKTILLFRWRGKKTMTLEYFQLASFGPWCRNLDTTVLNKEVLKFLTHIHLKNTLEVKQKLEYFIQMILVYSDGISCHLPMTMAKNWYFSFFMKKKRNSINCRIEKVKICKVLLTYCHHQH